MYVSMIYYDLIVVYAHHTLTGVMYPVRVLTQNGYAPHSLACCNYNYFCVNLFYRFMRNVNKSFAVLVTSVLHHIRYGEHSILMFQE